ncbi:BTB/POZ domain and ankyrin repeat-containing protein NPR1-like [Lycium ferocissimum]|uniref:BTB/POZ domain and ankyrin repeat-containing protein NPR1-like n=1 Tax=Lycium ferocissimum TaxID=112874 RepID=UPI002816593F|nr:BTB/POZ domain and ankyrin repeat-containing protein NPR1-like [Lycium ferocissimum]
MASSAEPSSSISFTSTSNTSNGSNGIGQNTCAYGGGSETGTSYEIISLSKLSNNLEQLLLDSKSDFSDAEIVVEGVSLGVHRCILAARSTFFKDLFKKNKGSCGKEGKSSYSMIDILPYGKVGYEAFLTFLSYMYSGKLKHFPPEVSTCVDTSCAHDSCRPAINFHVELMYASFVFQVPELVSLFLRRLINFVGKALVEDVIPILGVAFHCQLTELLTHCVDRVARSDLESTCIEKEVPFEVANSIKLLRVKCQVDESKVLLMDPLHEKRKNRIYKALDSDDVELVKLLLHESDISLDEAYALHYAVAYCDPKVVTEVLGLGVANVNLRNTRGYTVLHIAAMRKEPSIIVSLLTKGAHASEITLDGQSSVTICRRLTRPKEYHAKTEQGQEAIKDRVCIDVLEREMRRNPMARDASFSSPMLADDLPMKLLYLENRVAFARLLFPLEAKLAMEIANAETTAEFAGHLASKGSSGNLREVDLNETPIMQKERLSRTVELGKRYFPHCSQVLDKFMEDDLPDLFFLEKGTPEEQKIKRKRFKELKDDVQRAFTKDKAERHCSGLSPSSSSTTFKDNASVKLWKL